MILEFVADIMASSLSTVLNVNITPDSCQGKPDHATFNGCMDEFV